MLQPVKEFFNETLPDLLWEDKSQAAEIQAGIDNFFNKDIPNFFTKTIPDFFVNTVWNDWIVDKVWNTFCVDWVWNKFCVNYVWNDLWKNLSEDKVFGGILSLSSISAYFAHPLVGLGISLLSGILWFRTLFY